MEERLTEMIKDQDVLQKTVKKIESLVNNTSLNSLKNNVYTETILSLERLVNFKAYIKKQPNDENCIEFAIKNLILPNRELWNSLVSSDNYFESPEEKEAFTKIVEYIKRIKIA